MFSVFSMILFLVESIKISMFVNERTDLSRIRQQMRLTFYYCSDIVIIILYYFSSEIISIHDIFSVSFLLRFVLKQLLQTSVDPPGFTHFSVLLQKRTTVMMVF